MANNQFFVKFIKDEQYNSIDRPSEMNLGPFPTKEYAFSFILCDMNFIAGAQTDFVDLKKRTSRSADGTTWKLEGIGKWTIEKLVNPLLHRFPAIQKFDKTLNNNNKIEK